MTIIGYIYSTHFKRHVFLISGCSCSCVTYIHSCIDFILVSFVSLSSPKFLSPSPSPPSPPSPVPHPALFPPNWITTFHVPWEKMAPIQKAISMKQRAAQSDRLLMIRWVIVDAIRMHCPNPTRAECTQIAKNIVAQYPKTFADITDEGDLLGCGYTSLLN